MGVHLCIVWSSIYRNKDKNVTTIHVVLGLYDIQEEYGGTCDSSCIGSSYFRYPIGVVM